LHFVDASGNDLTYPYCGSDPRWVNGTTVFHDETSVPAGGTAHYGVHVCGQAGYVGPATLRLQYVQEGVAHYNPIFPLQINFYSPQSPPPTPTAPPGSVAGAYEPNDTKTDAFGPLVGGTTYSAAIETDNDSDWFAFYTSGPNQLQISISGRGPDDCFGPVMYLRDRSGDILGDRAGPTNRSQTKNIKWSATKADTFYLEISPYNLEPCAGSDAIYDIEISASSSLAVTAPPTVTNPPPGGSDGCQRARERKAELVNRLHQANTRAEKRRLRRKLRRARDRVRELCALERVQMRAA
jgi:hypothetical protein